MLSLERITIYPIKSLDGLVVDEAHVLPAGGLANDRRWQLVDMEGRVVNGKRMPLLHAIRSAYSIEGLAADAEVWPVAMSNAVRLTIDPPAVAASAVPGVERMAGLRSAIFPLVAGRDGPCEWLSEALGVDVLLVERRDGGFPDDRDAAGPTLAATATLVEVARWFRIDLEECRRRFRVNLEIGGGDPFWEDTLACPIRRELCPPLTQDTAELPADPYADLPPPEPRVVTIGGVSLRVTNVCRRCVVPSRDSRTGRVTEHFRDVFESYRQRTIRDDVDATSWSHWYRLALNTVAFEAGAITCGDPVRPG